MRFNNWLEDALFRPMSVNRQSTVMVHSAFTQLSRQDVQAESLCQFLTRYFCEGNVIMPTMTWRTVNKNNCAFDEKATPSHTGVLTEIFRTQFATHRSLHPTHSVAALGVDAQYLTHSHHLDSGPCSTRSPYGLIESSDLKSSSFILLIGVALESCTYIHLFEEIYNPDAFLVDDDTPYSLKSKSGETHVYTLKRHTKRTRDFHQFGKKLANIGGIKMSQYGDCDITLVNVEKLSQVLHEEFNKSPHATFCNHSYQM
ncbi:AAC(3) family N-acetyltransferase [Pseudoalteromonas luteoviolacea]|uniref:AAC(3) family N-acetyltransferase n=1 Tax=Pseudoalteromonas luteoviolacea TaxID=43657 RepID=UPI001F3DF0A6|nr:AAC(3) family N-acetyltransferase [Pseudoalteromonas luteoviolacea]MCF6440350.1 AAC(3) family N-acetyltransferase [Pseudoalteromonas luteoviolacea]